MDLYKKNPFLLIFSQKYRNIINIQQDESESSLNFFTTLKAQRNA